MLLAFVAAASSEAEECTKGILLSHTRALPFLTALSTLRHIKHDPWPRIFLTSSRIWVVRQSGFVLQAQQATVTATSSGSAGLWHQALGCGSGQAPPASGSAQLSTGGKAQSKFVLFVEVAVYLYSFWPFPWVKTFVWTGIFTWGRAAWFDRPWASCQNRKRHLKMQALLLASSCSILLPHHVLP